ncbi:N-acetyl-alpha-D-glucosaminyl L-malate synthase BshA [Bacillus carboniphilus]|uniref:N-acetyl-alpha-D-glucosaminyl L-malate synthase BshA n=1 Tax=Bacillus carboniphilus TaxID=86663 RepID=A0ABN0WRV3_9BACI
MKILIIWRLLTVGGVNAGWRNRAIYFKKRGITTEFLYCKDLGGMHMMQDVATVYLTQDTEEINQIILKNHYDAIVVVDTSKAYSWLEKVQYDGPILVEARTPEITKLSRNLNGVEKISPSLFIVPTSYQKRVLSILIDQHAPIKVINNCLNTSFFRPLDQGEIQLNHDPILPKNKKVVAYIGRLDVRKNWRLLLRIAKSIRMERNDIEFWVIGGARSVERDLFEQEWKSQGLTEVVKWFPVVPYQQMPHLYAKIRKSGGCTISTTKSESFGNTFIESMACGVPVVAPDISSVPEIVKHGETGFLYKEEHVKGAAECIYRLIDRPHRYDEISKTARNRVEEYFSLPVCSEQYIQLLSQIVKRGNSN